MRIVSEQSEIVCVCVQLGLTKEEEVGGGCRSGLSLRPPSGPRLRV